MSHFLLFFFVGFSLIQQCTSTSKFTQSLGISGKYITTSIGIGSPPQFFDLAISTNSDEFVLLDYKLTNSDVDYQYNYVKQLFVDVASETCQLSEKICRLRQSVDGKVNTAFGKYNTDYITLGYTTYGLAVRFCKIETSRDSASSTYNDPLKWLFEQKVDGFLGLGIGRQNPISSMRANTGSNQITLWLDKEYDEPDEAGQITFGGPNFYQCSQNLRSVFLEDDDDWKFFVNDAKFGSYEDRVRGLAMFDLSSDSLVIPRNTFQGLKEAYGGDIMRFYCNTYKQKQSIKLTVYGIIIEIDVRNFIKKLENDTNFCELKIEQAAQEDEIQLIFGKQILYQYCITLDYDDFVIKFAEAKQ